MSACIISRINIEAPEECDVDCLVADIWYCIYRFYLGTGKILQGHNTFSSPADGTQGINIELAINEELFAESHKIVDALIEKIEEHILNNGAYKGVEIAGTELMLGDYRSPKKIFSFTEKQVSVLGAH